MNNKQFDECLKTQKEINKNLRGIIENLKEWTKRSGCNISVEENPNSPKNKE